MNVDGSPQLHPTGSSAGQTPPSPQVPQIVATASPSGHTMAPPVHQAAIGVSPPHTAAATVQVNNQYAGCNLNAPSYGGGQFTPTSHQTPMVPGGNVTAPVLMPVQTTNVLQIPGRPAPNQRLRLAFNGDHTNIYSTPDQTSLVRAQRIIQDNLRVIEELVRFQEEYELPKEEDIKNLPPCVEGQSESQYKHITEVTILSVKLVVEFAKKVHGFNQLTRSDQITLLKACASEVLMLKSTKRYDIKTDSILFVNNQPFTRENYRKAHIGGIADAMFNFCRSTVILRLDPAEYALVTALIIFSERPNLIEPHKVEEIQEYYLQLMQAYVESHGHQDDCKFAKLLALLPELRSLGIVNSDVCFSLKVKKRRLPEFLAEIWDVDQDQGLYSDED